MASPFVIGSTTYVAKKNVCSRYVWQLSLIANNKSISQLDRYANWAVTRGNLVVVAAAVETVRADTFFGKSDRFY